MTDEEREQLLWTIDSEGFEYAIENYSGKINDPEFQALKATYEEAKQALEEYIGELEIDDDTDQSEPL